MTVPVVRGFSVLAASLAYANAGWFVLPVLASTKHAGSILGKGWPDKSSQDPRQLRAWFSNPGVGLALHVGRSGAVVFDVDDPDKLPDVLSEAVQDTQPPFQSTRAHTPNRGHYAFLQPSEAVLGNGKGRLAGSWGEVRGKNGVIIVEPSAHEKHATGGRYVWMSTGPLPALPKELLAALLLPAVVATRPTGERGGSSTHGRLSSLVKVVLDSEEGERNAKLFWVAARLGEQVDAGRLSEARAVELLLAAGRRVGLQDDELIGSGRGGTIFSGLRASRGG